jgi:hypothetical protein
MVYDPGRSPVLRLPLLLVLLPDDGGTMIFLRQLTSYLGTSLSPYREGSLAEMCFKLKDLAPRAFYFKGLL